jgi:hypothetical protein
MSSRSQNEKKFGGWEELPGGGRRYRLDVAGRLGWQASFSPRLTSMTGGVMVVGE